MRIVFSPTAWEQYTQWQSNDKRVLKRINDLIQDVQRNGLAKGIGKPELLKHRKAWSRRINKEHRLVYQNDNSGNLLIVACKHHYED